MVLEVASKVVADHLSGNYVPYLAAGLAGVVVARSRSKGFVCQDERNVTNKTWIIVGGFSGPGLVVLRQLAALGSQVIALHPDPSSPAIHQLIVLLRESSGNERIYADECDVLSIKSIRAFAKRWEKDGRAGMVGDLEARIEGVVFCDGEGSGLNDLGMGLGKTMVQEEGERMELNHLGRVVSRHAFIQLLLPSLSKSSLESPVRIISQISPFYSASSPLLPPFDPSTLDLDYSKTTFRKWEPWTAEGKSSLLSIALLRELQERLDESLIKSGNKGQGFVTVSISTGITRTWIRHSLLRATFGHIRFSWIGFVLSILLFPIIWCVGKSAEEAAQGLLMAVLAGVERVEVPSVPGESVAAKEPSPSTTKKGQEEEERMPRIKLRGGAVYAEGKPIRITRLEDAGPTLGPALWTIESKRVEKLVTAAAKEEKEKELKEKTKAK